MLCELQIEFMKIIQIALLATASMFLFGCQSSNRLVAPGEFDRLYASTGVFVELFVSPSDPEELLFKIGSESAEDEYISVLFDGRNVKRIFLMKGLSGSILTFDEGILSVESMSLFQTVKEGETILRKRYRFEKVLGDEE